MLAERSSQAVFMQAVIPNIFMEAVIKDSWKLSDSYN